MENLAINDQPKALSQYSRHQIDRTYADQYESVLGHLICERGRSVKAALEDLRPIVSQTRRETLSAIDWCQKLGFGGVGVGILVGAGMGMGFAILPILAGTISIKFWADSRSELSRRDAEYHLLKTTPNLPEALYALHLRGVAAVKIVGAYDQLVSAIEARLEGDGEFTESEVGEFLQVKVSSDMVLGHFATATNGAVQDGESLMESAAIAPTELQEPIASKTYICVQSVGEIPDHTQTGSSRDLAEKLALAQGFSWSDLKKQDEKEQKNGLPWFNFLFENPACYPSDFWCRLYEQPIAHSADAGNMVASAPSVQFSSTETTIARAAEPNYLARIWQIIDRNNNFFVGGQPGSGKGVIVSNLIRRKLDQYPGSIAVWIDPKGSPREDGNFKDPRITRLKICGIGMSQSEYSIEVAEMLETARSFVDECDIENGKRVWIVFDEIMNMKQKLDKNLFKEVQDLMVDCVTMGDDQGLHTIALTQSFNAGDNVGSDEILKNLALIACFKEDDFPRVKKLVQYGKTNHESFSTEEFSRLVRKSPRKRVICIGGTFIPAPEMPLLSGWDRDKGSKVATDSPSTVEPPPEPEKSTWIGEGRSEVVFDDSWDLLLRAVATQAIVSTGLQQNIILSAVKNAQILNKTGKETEAIALLQAQLP